MAPFNLHALSYDSGIFEHSGPLQVHAVFPHAWHLRSTTRQILSVVVSRWDGPLTIRVTALPRVTPGSAAILRQTGLEVGETVLSVERAQIWTGQALRSQTLDPAILRADLGRVRDKVAAAGRGGLARALKDAGGSCGDAVLSSRTRGDATDPWLLRGRKEVTSLCESVVRQDRAGTVRHAVGLLGLGPGLTPAGDDVLCGLLAGLSVLGRRSNRQGDRCESTLTALAACVVAEAPRRTTALSNTLLRSAAHGIVTEPLLHLLETVGSGTEMSGIDDVLMLGHSSGSDMLTGALLAGATLVRWEELFGPALVGSR